MLMSPTFKRYFIVITMNATAFLFLMHLFCRTDIVRESKKQQLFQCRNSGQLTYMKRFYYVDCSNPFLKALVEGGKSSIKNDACDNFSALYTRIPTEFRSFTRFNLADFNKLLEACPQCHHLQVINGELYIVPRPASFNYESRSRSVKNLFKYVIDTFDDMPNLELLVHMGDSIILNDRIKYPLMCPVFGFAKNKRNMKNNKYTDGIISIPGFSFWSWPQVRLTKWDKEIINIKQASDNITFAKRISKLFWRGATTGKRAELVSIAQKHPEVMDVSFMKWQRTKDLKNLASDQYRTPQQHCDYKFLLHLEGETWAERLKFLLLCGGPVIFAQIYGWEEFWYHLLKHKENIMILDSANETLLLDMMNYLLEDLDRASRIGLNGQNIVLKYLNEQAIACYVRNMLLTYRNLMDYTVTKHAQAVLVDDFLVSYLDK